MEINLLEKMDDFAWRIPLQGKMRVPGIIFASENLINKMDMKVYEQLSNVASLPGIVEAAYAMPDAHWGYGFPIGGVAAFDPQQEGVVSAGGVGFDISCGVRLLTSGIEREQLESVKIKLADALYKAIPAGVGSTSGIILNMTEVDKMLVGGAKWAVTQGYGEVQDLDYIEEKGTMLGANPDKVSSKAKERQRKEMGSLGSGNHYLEIQEVSEIYDPIAAQAMGLVKNQMVISIHCGSRGLGHQIGTDYLRSMAIEAKNYGIELPDRELACAPILSSIGQDYLGAMRAGINCALANRQILTHFLREIFQEFFPHYHLRLAYDVSHNTCKEEIHEIAGQARKLFVHRKGATRAFGPGHKDLPAAYATIGQPVIIGGSMGTASYILVGTSTGEQRSLSSACHGAGRSMSRHQATKQWHGRQLVDELAHQGIIIRSLSYRGIAEEAPLAYKDIDDVVNSAQDAKLAKKVAKLIPLVCIKG